MWSIVLIIESKQPQEVFFPEFESSLHEFVGGTDGPYAGMRQDGSTLVRIRKVRIRIVHICNNAKQMNVSRC